jgi:hypothetical protein
MDGGIACRNTADGAEFTISIPLAQDHEPGRHEP